MSLQNEILELKEKNKNLEEENTSQQKQIILFKKNIQDFEKIKKENELNFNLYQNALNENQKLLKQIDEKELNNLNNENLEIEGLKNVNEKLIIENKNLNEKNKQNEEDKNSLILTLNQLKQEIKNKDNEIIQLKNEKNKNISQNKSCENIFNDNVSKLSSLSGNENELLEKYKKKYKEQKMELQRNKIQLDLLKEEIRELKQKIPK